MTRKRKPGRVPGTKKGPSLDEMAMTVLLMYWLTVQYMDLDLNQTSLTLKGVEDLMRWEQANPEKARKVRDKFNEDPEYFVASLMKDRS